MKKILESLYKKYNKKEYIYPDPLIFLHENKFYNSKDIFNREIVALIAATFAYGRVFQIIKTIEKILNPMNKNPKEFILKNNKKDFIKSYKGFKHRFNNESFLADFLIGIKTTIKKYDSLENLFLENYSNKDKDILNALTHFTKTINIYSNNKILSNPSKNSACKRLNLFLKWMTRSDNVDPGGWSIDKSKLLIPLDTHIYKFSRKYNFTKRNSADLKTALEITEKFKEINKIDPIKYDFVITRFGINPDFSLKEFK